MNGRIFYIRGRLGHEPHNNVPIPRILEPLALTPFHSNTRHTG